MKKILVVSDLTTGYKKNAVIKNISFEIGESEFIGIIGPNASGKTTLLRTIARVLPFWSGEIFVDGKDIKKYDHKEFARTVSFATKITNYSLNFKVKDFLVLGRYPWGFQYFDISLCEEFEIVPLFEKRLRELSSGELQRVIVAQSIVQTSKVLLLDEPISHLDISHQITILNYLKKINKQQKITILSSFHELNLAGEYCDKLILISNGEIKKIGSVEDVLDYRILEEVYKTTIVVKINPISKKPYVIPVATQIR